MNSLQVNDLPPPNIYPPGRFRALLVVLVLLLALIAGVQWVGPPVTERSTLSESSLQADISAKLSYAREPWEDSAELHPDRQQVISQYRRAFQDEPSPSYARRLVVIQHHDKRQEEIKRLEKVATGLIVTPATRKKLLSEAAMWRDVYVNRSPLSSRQVEEYASRIRRLDLGWYEHLALADLYERANMSARAWKERADARRAAGWTAGLLSMLMMMGAAGIVLVIVYVRKLASRRVTIRNSVGELAEDARGLVAGCLLETFVIYLGILVGTQLAAAFGVAAGTLAGREVGPAAMVLVTSVTYILGGALALVYLAFRLRHAGWSWKMVGLTSRNPLLDIAWGIGGYAAALPLLGIAGLFSELLNRYVRTPPNPVIPLFMQAEGWAGKLVLLVLVSVAAPFFEELFFRGVLYNSFRAKWGVAAGIALSAAVFAIIHPLPFGFLPIFVLGSVFATLLYHRGSLLPSMVAHGMNNGVAFALLFTLTGS